jgi:F-type H+-transporting ATPase subunit b
MQLAGIFLLPNGTFFVELLVFAVILFLITKYIVPPLNKAMEGRQEKIRTALESAEQARLDAAAADDEKRAALDEARGQAREIIAQANHTADQIRADATAPAQAEADRIRAAGEADVALAKQRAVEEAAAQMGEVVLSVVEKIVGREVNAASHQDLIDEAIGALKASSGGKA